MVRSQRLEEVNFLVQGKLFKNVWDFWYLGRIMKDSDSNWAVVQVNLKSRKIIIRVIIFASCCFFYCFFVCCVLSSII